MEGKERTIKDWAPDDRPREKLVLKGAAALSDSELLAIFIRGGYGTNAVKLARDVLDNCQQNLLELGRQSVHDLMKIRGIGMAKACTLVAALELGRRWNSGLAAKLYPILKDSRGAENYLRPLLEHQPYEVFGVLYLAQSGKIKQDFEIISTGGITSTTVDPRKIFRRALEIGAVSMIVAHNHPSGNVQPSKADEALTQKLLQGSKFLDIKLLDHVIIGREGYFSFADEGLLAA